MMVSAPFKVRAFHHFGFDPLSVLIDAMALSIMRISPNHRRPIFFGSAGGALAPRWRSGPRHNHQRPCEDRKSTRPNALEDERVHSI